MQIDTERNSMPDISLCMIVKDEEKNIEKCLESVKYLADEIIIADTGSSDRTKEIALKYTNRVFDYKWDNDFSKARNFSISQAKHDIILILDADEMVIGWDKDELYSLIQSNEQKIGEIEIINEYSRKGQRYKSRERLGRLFSKRFFYFEGMIHEQIVSKGNFERELYTLPITIYHTGYAGSANERKQKAERNINLLKQQLLTGESPYILYQIGKSYYMSEEYGNACNYFGQALAYDLDIKLVYVQDMVELYGYSLINTEQYEEAMNILNIYEEFSHSADFVFMVALVLMNNERFDEAIKEFEKATRITECKVEGVNGSLAYYNIGVIYECLGNKKKALEYYNKLSKSKA